MIIIFNESKNKHGDNDDDGNDNYEFHNEICFFIVSFFCFLLHSMNKKNKHKNKTGKFSNFYVHKGRAKIGYFMFCFQFPFLCVLRCTHQFLLFHHRKIMEVI